MKYYVQQVTLNNTDFIDFEKETWKFGKYSILTPHGNLELVDVTKIDDGKLVGIQFSVLGSLSLGEIEGLSSKIDKVKISTLAVLRQPHNVWLWIYTFDDAGNPIAAFCGNDDIDGFSDYIFNDLKLESF